MMETTNRTSRMKRLLCTLRDAISWKLSPKHLGLALGAATLLTTGTASATLMDAIDALAPSDMYRVLFMTSTRGHGNLDDIGVYNQRVTDAASAGSVTNPLGLSWSALASTAAVNAQANTGVTNGDNSSVSFFNTLGDLIAVSGLDLWDGSLLTAILADENGGTTGNASGEWVTWTGTDATGGTSNPLGGEAVVLDVRFGFADQAGSNWMDQALNPNDFQRSLYGVSSMVTIPGASVPEPASIFLFGLGLAGLGFSRRRKV